ncbi:hypothetical protein ABZ383_06680 [Streptomyces sp. NPDC005900]|uniref:hypothetical protein n=1 Tax=Streptomyces sp. NPDC005900 TaxID=3154569 RepID=UPI003404DE32
MEGTLELMESKSVEHLADLGGMLTDHYNEALYGVIEAKTEHRSPAPVTDGQTEAVPVVT